MTAINPSLAAAIAELGVPLSADHRQISDLDVPLPVVEADTRLQALLAAPPAGHTKTLQPADWYEAVFDLLACTHPETCTCTPEESL